MRINTPQNLGKIVKKYLTDYSHDYCWLSGWYLLEHGQDLVYNQPLVQMSQEFACIIKIFILHNLQKYIFFLKYIPRQMRQLTLTDRRVVVMHSFLTLGRTAFFVA